MKHCQLQLSWLIELMVGWEFFLDDDMDGYTRKLTPALALKLLDQ
jgi:hypothetical protein